MSNPVQITKNKTRVLDPGVDTAPMVVVYRGLGPEMGKDYAYDTADWILDEIQKAIPQEVLNKIIFAVPDDYNQDCETSIHQAETLIQGNVSFYSLCGFSKGGAPFYKNISRRPWKTLGLIDAVSPTMEGLDDDIVDKYASKIRCIYGVSHWGTEPRKGKRPSDFNKSERVYTKTKDFYDHLKELNVDMIDGDDNHHYEMPRIFFKKYGQSFL